MRDFIFAMRGTGHGCSRAPIALIDFSIAFRFESLPWNDQLSEAPPAGPCAAYPNEGTSTETPVVEGVVLIGDAAGYDDPTMGQGLANALQDARLAAEAMFDCRDWSPHAFRHYVELRHERSVCQKVVARIFGRLQVEFGSEAHARRMRFQQRVADEANAALLVKEPLVGSHTLLADVFEEQFWCPLVQ